MWTLDEEFSRLPPWLKTLATISGANWLVWWGVSVYLHGTALGTKVHHNLYVLVEYGRLTPVSQPIWWFSLVYSWLSNLLPCVLIWVTLLYWERIEPVGKVVVILAALFSNPFKRLDTFRSGEELTAKMMCVVRSTRVTELQREFRCTACQLCSSQFLVRTSCSK